MTDNTEKKTNAIRALERSGLPFSVSTFSCSEALSGLEVAQLLGLSPEVIFKTLVTENKVGRAYVFMVPVNQELDLKKAARSVNEKSLHMLRSKDLLPVTGYVHGGCSPVGMKKQFPTVVDLSAQKHLTIYFSGGRIGCQVSMSIDTLSRVIPLTFADITISHENSNTQALELS